MSDVSKAFPALLDMKKAVQPRLYPSHQALAAAFQSEEIWISANYSARAVQWEKEGLPIRWAYPKEGAIFISFGAGIPKKARNVDAAYAYLEAVLQPRPMGAISQATSYSVVTNNADVPADDRKRLAVRRALQVRSAQRPLLLRLFRPSHGLQQTDQAHVRIRVVRANLQEGARVGQCPLRHAGEAPQQFLQHVRMKPPRRFAFRDKPRLIGMAVGKVETFEEIAAKSGLRPLQHVDGRRRFAIIERPSCFKEIDTGARPIEADRIAVGDDTPGIRLVDEPAQLAQTPSKGATRVVRNVPEHFAETRAPMPPRFERQVGEQRARLA